jgi:hypothetical protein
LQADPAFQNWFFSIDDPGHVKIANAIEIRLPDQDLLPR